MSAAPAPLRPQRPELTFPPKVAERVRAGYGAAHVILEYGSGGSTVMASEMPGKTVFSVENDTSWAADLAGYLAQADGASPVHLHVVDTGATGRWGRPKDDTGWRSYPNYALSVWDRDDFQHPDIILIDGRFRAACLATTIFRATRPVTVLFDDYTNRAAYHSVEAWVQPSETVGRMACFEITPRALAPADMAAFVALFQEPY